MPLPMSASSAEAARAALLRVIPSVFPWVRHLSAAEREEFVAELLEALDDASGRDSHADVHRAVVEWRATARVLAGPELTAQLTRRLPGDHLRNP